MPHAGQEIEGPGGFRLRLIRTAAETGGELLEMEATYAGGGALPPEHLHPNQVERFEVLEGAVRAIVDGGESSYEAGERFEIPAGARHQMTADAPARVNWQVRPALRTAEFFERLYAAIADAGAGEDVRALLEEFRPEVELTGR